MKQKCINVTAKETEFVRKNLTDELKNVAGELEVTKHLLDEKELENHHLAIIGQQRSTEYTMNLESMISEGNVLRHQLTGL